MKDLNGKKKILLGATILLLTFCFLVPSASADYGTYWDEAPLIGDGKYSDLLNNGVAIYKISCEKGQHLTLILIYTDPDYQLDLYLMSAPFSVVDSSEGPYHIKIIDIEIRGNQDYFITVVRSIGDWEISYTLIVDLFSYQSIVTEFDRPFIGNWFMLVVGALIVLKYKISLKYKITIEKKKKVDLKKSEIKEF